MLNKLGKFFSGAEKAPAAAQQSQSDAHTATSQADSAPPTVASEPSLLQLCDQKLNRWAKMFTGEDESPAIVQDTRFDAPPVAAPGDSPDIVQAPQAADKTGDLSLLQACDQKLSRWTKFFTGEQESPAATQEAQSGNISAAEAQAESAQPSDAQHELAANGDVSLADEGDQKADKWNRFFSGAKKSAPEIAAAPADADLENSDASLLAGLPEEREASGIMREVQSDLEFIEVQAAAPKPETHAVAAPAAEVQQHECKIEEQLQMLEQLLERQLNTINNTENGLCAVFKEELHRQLSAAAYSYEQLLFDRKNDLEVALKSAFDNIADRQDILGNNNHRQTELLRQMLEAHRADIVQLNEKLDILAEQIRQLTESMLQLTSNSSLQHAKVIAIDALEERVSALETPAKRRSWFKK